MVLLVVDTQKLITNNKLYNFDIFVSNVKEVIANARENEIEIIYVRHDDGIGNKLTRGTEGYEIYEDFKPLDNERIFDKTVNSAFKDTGLLEYLKEKNESNIMIVGLQTDYCIDASIKCGFEHGFHMIVPAYANTTVDNSYMKGSQSYSYYNDFIWKNRYAECISMDEVINIMKAPPQP